jgi:hypothetical protein
METLFEKAVIRIGIDTIKIKLDNISIVPFDPMNQLINDLRQSFDEDEISVFSKDIANAP